jgi:predicted ATP-grasp superfamily ATP-dependent carboligase
MSLFICVDPVGSKFAKAVATRLQQEGRKVFRVSVNRGRSLQQQGDFFRTRRGNLKRRAVSRKFFFVTPQTKDKIEQFKAFKEHGVSCPAFTTDKQQLSELGTKTIFARKLINSTNGRGIVEFNYGEQQEHPDAPLYTAYIPKKAEYRVHVFNGKVIDVQQKKKKREFEAEARNTRVRNCANGYVYTRDGITPPAGMDALAINAVNAVGYQYGAVDIIYNEKQDKCFVLEVNSRPGLMGTTLDKYAQAVGELA